MERLNIIVEIHGSKLGPRRANIRGNLLGENLVANIKDKFNLDGDFELWSKATGKRVNLGWPLNSTGVAEGSVLICRRIVEDTGTLDAIRRGERHRFSRKFRRVFLQEDTKRVEFDLLWHPAIIGRKDRRNPSNNRLLSADLEEIEVAPSVSRHHAAITEVDGSFFIESINERNLTILNGTKIRPGAKHPLPTGAIIQVGNITLTFQSIS